MQLLELTKYSVLYPTVTQVLSTHFLNELCTRADIQDFRKIYVGWIVEKRHVGTDIHLCPFGVPEALFLPHMAMNSTGVADTALSLRRPSRRRRRRSSLQQLRHSSSCSQSTKV